MEGSQSKGTGPSRLYFSPRLQESLRCLGSSNPKSEFLGEYIVSDNLANTGATTKRYGRLCLPHLPFDRNLVPNADISLHSADQTDTCWGQAPEASGQLSASLESFSVHCALELGHAFTDADSYRQRPRHARAVVGQQEKQMNLLGGDERADWGFVCIDGCAC